MRYARTIIGYHGCTAKIAARILNGEHFAPSSNDYDWLGHGVYFWEHGPDRALAPVFPGSGIERESHIQIAVRDPACIIGVFRPIL